ncbi:MAG: nucleotide sugar dehydrogenase [Oscillospiraceae bacterium]
MNDLLRRIASREALLTVVGLGYVGLPLAVEKAKAGFRVIGIDRNPTRVEQVNRGENYIGDVVDEELFALAAAGRLRAVGDFSPVDDADCVCLCVPTPLDAHQQPNLQHLIGSLDALAAHLHPGMLLVLESTTYPGTTAELVVPFLTRLGLTVGTDILVAFSPERVDPGNRRYSVRNTPKVVGGVTPACTEAAAALYEAVLDAPVVRVSSPGVAEMEKLLENVYRNVNIALVNELCQLCNKMGISVWEVIEAASSKPYGFAPFYPGMGPGGHCIPLDPWYLSWRAREFGFHTTLIEDAGRINDAMPDYCVRRISGLLSARGKALSGARILLLGAAYKADVADERESPALRLLVLLEREGAQLRCADPLLPEITVNGVRRATEPLAPLLDWCDLAVVGAAHRAFDWAEIARRAPLIFDTKNALRSVSARETIELL